MILAAIAAAANPVTDGKHIILGMLIVALVFLGAIGLGEFVHFTVNRRAGRRTHSS
jgi:hypothetical protein